jgi:hypothetical protein
MNWRNVDGGASQRGTRCAAGGGGGGRGGGMGGGGTFNCGMECTITQDGKALTIKRPANAQGTTPPDIVLNLTGVTKGETPSRQGGAPTPYEVTAKVDGAKWVLSRAVTAQDGTSFTVTQTISIEAGKLTIVTNTGREGMPPTTVTYTKKS